MINKAKKLLSAALTVIFLLPCAGVYAANVGDKIEQVLSTDIVTYIEGIKVPSFNIAGRTAVVVENLNAKNLPFDVWYDDSTRTLTIVDASGGARDFFHFDDTHSDAPIGTPIMDVVHTDIETFYKGEKLESFNIGGFTCVYAADLANLYGRYTFNEATRTVDIFRHKDEKEGEISSYETTLDLPAEESIITKGDTMVRWGNPMKSCLTANEDGSFTAIEYSGTLNIESYDSNFRHISSKKLKLDYPIFGGFLAGDEYFYVVSGQENKKESDTLVVINVSVYDKTFKKVKDIPIKECRTTLPFDACNVSIAENYDYLVIHTARSQYKEPNGTLPQTQLTIIIDKNSWGVVNSLEKFQSNHTSHAFKGYVKFDKNTIVTANYSDANPIRGAFIQEMTSTGSLSSTQSIFDVPGPASANCTGAMIGGFEVSTGTYFTALSSIDHSLAADFSDTGIEGINAEERDIFILATDKDSKQTTKTPLTYYSGEEKTASVPYLVKLEGGKYMVLWQRFDTNRNVSDTVCYAYLDRNGNLIGEAMSAKGYLSGSCQPIEADGKVLWYTNTDSGRIFYEIDSNPPENKPEV